MNERRHATKPHYRHSAEKDHAWLVSFTFGLTFLAGCMAGATLALGWIS